MQATQATIRKIGNSEGTIIPKYILDTFSLKERDKINFEIHREGILIKPAKAKRKSLRERTEEFYGVPFDEAIKNIDFEFTELETGKPVGKEVF